MKVPSNKKMRAYVQRRWADEGVLEIDDDAKVSRAEGGAYVQAWIWVYDIWVYDDDVRAQAKPCPKCHGKPAAHCGDCGATND